MTAEPTTPAVRGRGLMFRGQWWPATPPILQPCRICYADTERLVPHDYTENGVHLCRGHWGELERERAEHQRRAGAVR